MGRTDELMLSCTCRYQGNGGRCRARPSQAPAMDGSWESHVWASKVALGGCKAAWNSAQCPLLCRVHGELTLNSSSPSWKALALASGNGTMR